MIPEPRGSTWDFIFRSEEGDDIKFIEYAINTVRESIFVDDKRIALKGISDGGSLALCLATYNHHLSNAFMSVSSGVCKLAVSLNPTDESVALFLEHGEADRMFPLETVALPLRDKLQQAGFVVNFVTARGEGHVPSDWKTSFLNEWLSMPQSPTEDEGCEDCNSINK